MMLPDPVDGYEGAIARNSIGDVFRRTFKRTPDAVGLRFGERDWSYGELYATATATAAAFLRLGVGPGDRVLFLGRNSDQYVVGWLATVMAGAVHVPVNFLLQAHEIAYIVGHAEPTLAFADPALFPRLTDAVAQSGESVPLGCLGTPPAGAPDATVVMQDLGRQDGSGEPPGPASHRAIAQIAYTSGTEAAPKGVMLSHEALVTQYASCIVAGSYSPDDIVLNALPLYHCAQMHCFLMPSMALGCRNILLTGADPADMLRAIREHQVTSVFAPPTVWISLLRSPEFSVESFATVRKGYYGASIMPTSVIAELTERVPDVRLWNYYGQTEIAPLATVLGPDEQLSRAGSAGRPVLHVETRVVDDAMQDVPRGEVGEIVHRSPQLLTGYFKSRELTERAFAGGWFHSGDLAVMDTDGYITIVDRKKDMINTGGENVSSREVEEALYQLDGVAEVAVVGLPDPRWIERVCAVVVPRSDGVLAEDAVVAHARLRLAPYKVPKQVFFVDELPKNPSGKILKRELRERLSKESE